MVNVSKKKLPKDVEWELLKQLSAIIVAQQRAKDSDALLYELFTRSERLIFVKRVGIIALLQRGYSPYAISSALNVSETTVAKVLASLERGKYENIVATLKRREHRESVLGILESLVTFGLPGQPQKRLRAKIKGDIEAWRSGAK